MVGQNIGKYRVLDRVGRGGMGTVYRAIDETLHREVAIKVLNAELNDPEVARRFRAEAITVARLSHPGIATIYELFQHDGQWLMVMEFVRGETLERLIERTGPQAPERGAELCMHSLAALAHAHSMGVVHRDLKPANIMLTENGVIKIMDFGIARVAGTEHLTNAGFMMGTPADMAPEQVLGHEIDARADLYAMGVVFYRLLTGQLPFKGDTPFAMAQAQVNNPPTPVSSIRAGLPAWVDEVMNRSLAKKPEERFQSAVEFHEHFAQCIANQPAGSTPYRPPTLANPVYTPSQPLSTGTIAETVPTPRSGVSMVPPPSPPPAGASPSGSLASLEDSGVGPTIAAGTPVLQARPSTAELRLGGASGSMPAPPVPTGADDPSGAQTMLSPSGAQQILSPSGAQAVIAKSGAQPSDLFGSGAVPAAAPGASGAVPVPPPPTPPSGPATSVQMPTAQAPSGAPEGKKSSTGLIAVAAGLLVVVAGAAYFLTRPAAVPPTPEAAAPPPVTEPATPAPEPQPVAAATPSTPAQPAATTPATTASAGAARATTPAPGTAGAGSIGTGPTTAATTPGTSATATTPARGGAANGTPARGGNAATPPVDDQLLAVTDVRVLVVTGKKANDQEILLNFGNGQITLVNSKSGTPIAALPYRSIVGATYIRARDPRWNPALASPPTDLDVGGMLRTSKHYLALQTKDSYQILRLEDANVIRVLQAVEARSGITIDRPKSGDRN